MSNEDRVTEIMEKVEDLKTTMHQVEGRLAVTMDNLKKKFDCNDVESAKKLLQEKENSLDAVNQRYDKLMDDLEKMADWDNL